MPLHRSFSASIDRLHPMLVWIHNQLVQAGLDSKTIKKIELASEEILVNIIQYGYGQRQGTIDIALSIDAKVLEIEIKDQGPRFNPMEDEKEVDLDSPLETRKEGGLGLHFVRQIIDEVLYRREGGANIVTLKINRSSQKK